MRVNDIYLSQLLQIDTLLILQFQQGFRKEFQPVHPWKTMAKRAQVPAPQTNAS